MEVVPRGVHSCEYFESFRILHPDTAKADREFATA
jgi:hypothetical protein